MKFLELYSLGVPLYVPADFYMWAFSWTIADPGVMEDTLADTARAESKTEWQHAIPPYCATPGLHHLKPDACAYWAPFSDLARLPYIEYFDSLPDLLLQLNSAGLDTLLWRSEKMRGFQTSSLLAVTHFWQQALGALMSGNTTVLYEASRPGAT